MKKWICRLAAAVFTGACAAPILSGVAAGEGTCSGKIAFVAFYVLTCVLSAATLASAANQALTKA
ncbi:MAG: hypothetical protein UY92_C0001G0059 [Candidatus Magasanikbacteria bacterium GW2011_GWA2_56_11]|uniref:Lipoprotein n=1 Tax=Candidatus Magasanikbacteria bacterium GW2011_GWA2_56_11 TaxID=1619044 RepID=A0A0G1YIL7_9BACT|nr:MAG: hypothetical protein UY92_C0001G0059 [Candidatus Magasanikbacteria bacterium GW2011_GWA2_56_11]